MNESKLLIVVAHPDDETIGCGGTIARYSKNGSVIEILSLSDGETSRLTSNTQASSSQELITARRNAAIKATDVLGANNIEFHNFPDNRLDTVPFLDLVKIIEKKITDFSPNIVITHFSEDLNVDHRIVSNAVITAARPLPRHCIEQIWQFETSSSTEWNVNNFRSFTPNLFINISESWAEKKVALKHYEKEMRKYPHPRSLEALESLAKFRGSTVGIEYAEAFEIKRRII